MSLASNAAVVTGPVTTTAGYPTATISNAAFVSTDVGKIISIPGAASAGQSLNAQIITVNSPTSITLNKNAAISLAGVSKSIVYGTDDTVALQAMIDDPTTPLADLTSMTSIMVTGTLVLGGAAALNKTVLGTRGRTKIYVRPMSATAISAFYFATAAINPILSGFTIDYDAGPVTGSGYIVEFGCTGTVQNVEINGNATLSSPNITGIDASNHSNNLIQDCSIHDVTGNGISINNAPFAKVRRNFVTIPAFGLSGIVSQNIGFGGLQGIEIDENTVYVSAQPVSGVNTGILVRGDPTYKTYAPLVTRNFVFGTHGATASGNGSISGIYVNSGLWADNYVQDGGIGVSVGGGGYNNVISRNRVVSPTFYGIEVGGGETTIDSNNIDGGNILSQGIALQGDFGYLDSIITSNMIKNCTTPYFNSGAITNVVKANNIPSI